MSVVFNSTSMASGSIPGAEGLQMYGLLYLQAALTRYRPEVEILYCIALYSPFLTNHLTYTTTPKRARARGFSYLSLLVHIFTSYALIVRYHARYASRRAWPAPDTTDLVVFTVFALTAIYIEAIKSKAQPAAFRVSFHAAIPMHIGAFVGSWMGGGDPGLFRVSIKLLSWFAWFRLALPVLDLVEPRLKPMKHFGLKVEVTSIVSLSLSLWEAGYPYGIPSQLVLVSFFLVTERAIARMVSSYPDSNLFKKLVLATGFVDFEYMKEKTRRSEEPKAVISGMRLTK